MSTRRRARHKGMALNRILAQSTVSDLTAAERWYTALFGRGPDSRPMVGLLEWHVGETAGLQVWSEPGRAGRSTVVIGTDDVDVVVAALDAAGIGHEGLQPGGGGRILQLTDPDANRVVITGD
jgi:predicted enzyme related to lactoylglutathione lyase